MFAVDGSKAAFSKPALCVLILGIILGWKDPEVDREAISLAIKSTLIVLSWAA